MPTQFHFRWIPLIATLLTLSLGITLGCWQLNRAHEKEIVELKLKELESTPPLLIGADPQALHTVEYHRVKVKGQFVSDWVVYLENRPYRGIPGFYVMMPLRIHNSDRYVLVARGWAPRDAKDRTKLPNFTMPDSQDGIINIEGVARRQPDRFLQLGSPTPIGPNAIVQNIDPDQFAAASKFLMQPFIVEQSNNTHDELIRDWPRASLGIDKHYGYAFQWYALAVTALIFYIVTGFRRGK